MVLVGQMRVRSRSLSRIHLQNSLRGAGLGSTSLYSPSDILQQEGGVCGGINVADYWSPDDFSPSEVTKGAFLRRTYIGSIIQPSVRRAPSLFEPTSWYP